MRLNNIKNEPVKIVSFAILTFLLFYFTIGNILTSLGFTTLSMWFCTMPRLEHEDSCYKDKLPKFLAKKDFINVIIRVLIPLLFSVIFVMTQASSTTIFESSLKAMLMFAVPLLISIIHGFVLNKYKYEWDWITPFVMSILVVLGVEFVLGNLGDYFKGLFPIFFGGVTDVGVLWTFLLQVFAVYAFYRIISVLIPGRTISMFVTAFVFLLIAFVHYMFITHIGKPFFIGELFQIKQAVALIKIVIVENFDVTYIIKAGGTLLFITVVSFLLNKETSIYNIPTRFKSFCCGILVLAVVILFSNNFYNGGINTPENCEKTYGYTYYMMNNLTEKNTYDEELQKKIEETAKELFSKEEDKEKSETPADTKQTDAADDHSDFTIGE